MTTVRTQSPTKATATRNRLRNDLERCVEQADRLGLSAIAIYVQRAVDELASAKS